jgi:DNA-binding response OmpR family regulator
MKVLVADSNPLIRELLQKALLPLEWQFEVLSDGTDALAYLNSLDCPFLAFLGVDLPGISGIEIARRFVGRHPEQAICTVLVTTRADGEVVEEGFNAGASDLIVLPAPIEAIRARAQAAARTMMKMAAIAAQARESEVESVQEPTDPTVRNSGSSLQTKFQRFNALSKAQSLIVESVAGMGFGSVQPIKQFVFDPSKPNYASWCCIVAPNCSVWVDFLVEADRTAGMQLFEKLTGVPPDCPADASDTLGEIVNLIQGGIKSALQAEGHDTLTPVVPKVVSSSHLEELNRHVRDRVRLVVDINGATFCVTMFVFATPIVRKTIEALRPRDVTAEALPMPNDVRHKLLNRGVMLDDRWITNLRNRFLGEGRRVAINVVEPPPLINLLAGVGTSSVKAVE